MKRIALTVLALIFGSFTHALAQANAPSHVGLTASWGDDAGRASPADRAALERDLDRLLNSERALNIMRQDPTQILSVERQRELLGIDEPSAVGAPLEHHLKQRSFWAVNVLQPALDIAANPAATCDLARRMGERVSVMDRESQLLGTEDGTFGDIGGIAEIYNVLMVTVARRCLEEAYDECMLTGAASGFKGSIFQGVMRQRSLLLGDDEEWDQQVLYVVRRCAVYKLDYSMTLRMMRATAGNSLTSEWTGSYVLLFDEGIEGVDLNDRLFSGNWRPHHKDPPDITLVRVTCETLRDPSLSDCMRMPEERNDGGAVLRVGFKHVAREQVARVLYEPGTTVLDRAVSAHAGGRKQIEHTLRPEGADGFRLHFGPPVLFLQSRVRGREMDNFPAGGTDLFYDAHSSENGWGPVDVLAADATRGDYPLLFTASSAARPPAGPNLISENSRFELTHRPDLFPQEFLIPEYEVQQTQARPPRIRA